MKPLARVLLFRQGAEWVLSRWSGDIVPSSSFKTATEARQTAKSRRWKVYRTPDFDTP